MKYLIVPLILAISACATTSQKKQPVGSDGEIIPYIVTEAVSAPISNNLFSEAHRCQGIVKYQAEMQNGEMRSRLTCEWQVTPDTWGIWE